MCTTAMAEPLKNDCIKQKRRVVTELSREMLCENVEPSCLFFGAVTIIKETCSNPLPNEFTIRGRFPTIPFPEQIPAPSAPVE